MNPTQLETCHPQSQPTGIEQVIGALGGQLPYVVTDYPPEQREEIFAAVNGESKPLMECVGQKIRIQGYAVTPAQKEIEGGEILTMPRLALVGTDGKVYTSFSLLVLQKFHQLTLAVAFSGGLRGREIVVRAIPCKQGKTLTFDLVPAKGKKHVARTDDTSAGE